MAGNVGGSRLRGIGIHQVFVQEMEAQTESDAEASPVPSSTFSDLNDASSRAETESLPAWTSSWSPTGDTHMARIADPQNDVHPDWIIPSSPPSPPLRYDPRCRSSSPDTPSPLYAKCQKQSIRHDDSKARFSTQSPTTTQQKPSVFVRSTSNPRPAPVSRASSWLPSSPSNSEAGAGLFIAPPFRQAASPNPLLDKQSAPLPPSSFQSSVSAHASTSVIHLASSGCNPRDKNVQSIPNLLSRKTTGRDLRQASSAFPPFNASSHAWPVGKSAIGAQSYSTAVGAQARPGLAKLSRFRIPTSSGKKRLPPLAKHAHKRSCSVQWQQFERWQQKSRARLRDLLFLLLAMLIGALALWQLCFQSSRSTLSMRRQAIKLPSLATLPEPQRDTMFIYRILGNDLPPRHEVGQTLRNLRFMLSHENDFKHFSSPDFSPYNLKVDKYYVLNRITNETAMATIMALFKEYGVPQSNVLNIPFNLEEYKKQPTRWDGGVAMSKNLWGIGQPGTHNVTGEVDYFADTLMDETPDRKEKRLKRDLMMKLRAMEYSTHDKNLYAINNNGGRNFALEHGRSQPNARWIVPLDGNCFLTPPAVASLVQTMAVEAEGEGSKKHIIVPMARLLNNQDVLSENVEPWLASGEALQDLEIDLADAPEEPQVGFRWDSLVSYQSSMRYGRRSKLELLWRLGAIPFSRGLHIKRLPWEKQDHLFITPHSYASAVTSSVQQKQTTFGISDGDFAKAGWVHRLFSGDTSQEHSTTRAAELRRLNRMRGIVAYLETLDIKASLGSSNRSQITLGHRFWHWNQQTLSELREEMNGLARDAHKVNTITRLASDLQHRLSNKLRWQAATNSGLQVNEITGSALSLALSGYLCKNPHFSDAALKGVMAILSTPTVPVYQTTLSLGQPTMGYAFPTLPHILSGTQHSISLPYNPFTFEIASLLDAVKLVRLSQPAFIPNVAQQKWLAQMEDVFKQHLRVLLLSDDSLALSKAPRTLELALKYDTAVAALSAHLNLPSLVTRVQTRHSLRYLAPETGEPSSSDISTHPPYETFTTGMKNVALEQSQALSRSIISHSILDELIISMQGQ